MMRGFGITIIAVALWSILVTGCAQPSPSQAPNGPDRSGFSPAASDGVAEDDKPPYALEPGLVLTYTSRGVEVTSRVHLPMTVNGKEVIPVVTNEELVGYVAVENGWVMEYGRRDENGEKFWDTPVPFLPAQLKEGTSWEQYDEDGAIFYYTVEGLEPVSTAAGTFSKAFRVAVKTKNAADHQAPQDDGYGWFVPGLGEVLAKDSNGQVTFELQKVERETPAQVPQ